MKIKSLLILLCLSLLSFSCARTVTDKTTQLFLEVSLTFRNAMNLNDYNYLLVFSDSTSQEILYPTPYPDQNYLLVPGLSYDYNTIDNRQLTVQDFYGSYFDTWQDVISLHNSADLNSSINLINSNSTFFDSTTASNNAYQPAQYFNYTTSFQNDLTTVVLVFNINQIGTDTEGLKQFKFFVLDTSDGTDAGILLEALELEDSFFDIKVSEDTGIQRDFENTNIDGSADLVYWRIRVF